MRIPALTGGNVNNLHAGLLAGRPRVISCTGFSVYGSDAIDRTVSIFGAKMNAPDCSLGTVLVHTVRGSATAQAPGPGMPLAFHVQADYSTPTGGSGGNGIPLSFSPAVTGILQSVLFELTFVVSLGLPFAISSADTNPWSAPQLPVAAQPMVTPRASHPFLWARLDVSQPAPTYSGSASGTLSTAQGQFLNAPDWAAVLTSIQTNITMTLDAATAQWAVVHEGVAVVS